MSVSGEAKSSVPAVQTTISPVEGALSVQPGEIMALTLINLVNYYPWGSTSAVTHNTRSIPHPALLKGRRP